MKSSLMAPYAVKQLSSQEELERKKLRQKTPLRTWAELVAGGLSGILFRQLPIP